MRKQRTQPQTAKPKQPVKPKRAELAKLEGRLKRVENRVVTDPSSYDGSLALLKAARRPAIPRTEDRSKHRHYDVLTYEEACWDHFLRGGPFCPSPIQENIMATQRIVPFEEEGGQSFTVGATSTRTIMFNVCAASSPASSTPKAFESQKLTDVGGIGLTVTPGPAPGGSSTAVIFGDVASVDTVVRAGSSVTTPVSFFDRAAMVTSAPWDANAYPNQGARFRWRATRIGIRLVNTTVGSSKSSVAYAIQPRDNINNLAATFSVQSLMNYGLFKIYRDSRIGKGEGFEWFEVPNDLMAFHEGDTTAVNPIKPALFLILSCPGAVAQTFEFQYRIQWELAGAETRSLTTNHDPTPSATALALHMNRVKHLSNLNPSDQKPGSSFAAGIKMAGDKALQLVHNTLAGDHDYAHKFIKKHLGDSAAAIAKAGFAVAKQVLTDD